MCKYVFTFLYCGISIFLAAQQASGDTISLFRSFYDSSDTIGIFINTDLSQLLSSDREQEEYQPAEIIELHNGNDLRTWQARIRCRGNMRKKACYFPPFKIDFSKSDLDSLGYHKIDKLKMVIPCQAGSRYQQGLYKEHLIYELYQCIDSLGYLTRLVNVSLKGNKKKIYHFTGFLIEDEEDYSNRTGGQVIESGVLVADALDRVHYLKMMFFQYMILNQDFSIPNKHNLEMVMFPGDKRPKAIPYDFDYCGMVGQDYAVPAPSIPIETVRDPYFRGKRVNKEELDLIHAFFNDKRTLFEKQINEAEYLSKSTKKSMLSDISRFYKSLNSKKRWKHFCK